MTRRAGPPPRSIALELDSTGGCFTKAIGILAVVWWVALVVSSFVSHQLVGVVAALVIGPVLGGMAMVFATRYPQWIALDGDRLVWRYALQDETSVPVTEVSSLDRSYLSNEATITFRDGSELRSSNAVGFPGLADAIVRVNPQAQVLYGARAW